MRGGEEGRRTTVEVSRRVHYLWGGVHSSIWASLSQIWVTFLGFDLLAHFFLYRSLHRL